MCVQQSSVQSVSAVEPETKGVYMHFMFILPYNTCGVRRDPTAGCTNLFISSKLWPLFAECGFSRGNNHRKSYSDSLSITN